MVEELRRKECVSLKGPNQEDIVSVTGTSLGLSEISTIQTLLVLRGKDSLVGLSTKVWPLFS